MQENIDSKICNELKINVSDLTSKSDVNLENNISELLSDELFEDLDILGPEVKDLVASNPKIAKALIKLGDNFKQKDIEIVNKVENFSGKIIDKRKAAFPGEIVSDFLQENKNYFPELEKFAEDVLILNRISVLYIHYETFYTALKLLHHSNLIVQLLLIFSTLRTEI